MFFLNDINFTKRDKNGKKKKQLLKALYGIYCSVMVMCLVGFTLSHSFCR